MPSSAARIFADPDEFATSIRQGNCELTVNGRGNFSSELIRIDLHHLWMQRFSGALPWVLSVTDWGGRAAIGFRTALGPRMRWAGIEMAPGTIIRNSVNHAFYFDSAGASDIGTMSLPIAEIVSAGAALAGIDLSPRKDVRSIAPPPAAMARLQRLHAAAAVLAKHAPAVIAHPEAARGLEQGLIEAMIDCLGTGEVQEDRAALRQHQMIMRKFHRVVAEHPDQPLYIPELCRAIGTSERALRVCCEENIGMGPKRYLVLRRMNFARQALMKSARTETTVTEIATRYGFWQFGRFAGEYKSLFGELPSATLAGPVSG